MREQLDCMEPCLGRADELTESLWPRTEEKMGEGALLQVSAIGHPTRKNKRARPPKDR